MWPFNRKPKAATFDYDNLFIASPKNANGKIERRWGWTWNTGHPSTSQFNLYKTMQGKLYLTMQKSDGSESEKLIHLPGGFCASIEDAYFRVSSLLVDMIIINASLKKKTLHAILIVDCTPGRNMKPLSILEWDVEQVFEIYHEGFDEAMSYENIQ